MTTEIHSELRDTHATDTFRHDVIKGLGSNPKSLLSKYLYDETGDRLFQEIMAMPDYYLTRCELDIFRNRTGDLAQHILKDIRPFDLIELGAGDALKSSYLLKFMADQGVNFTYMPIDISEHILIELQKKLRQDIKSIDIVPLAGEYFSMLARATSSSSNRKVVLFLGSNIGNMEWNEIRFFCLELNKHLSPGDLIVIGFDLRKNPHVILNAYNDNTGITAAFNLNILNRINRELGADFIVDYYQHFQNYDPLSGACRSYLVSLVRQQVQIGHETFDFEENELINIEVSQKFLESEIDMLAEQSGFETISVIKDSKGWFIDAVWQVK